MSSAKRIESFRRLLEHAHERLKLEFGFRLWDGSRVPADYPRDGFAVSFADEGVVAALLRKPKIDTLANLWVSARIDVVNGTIFDLVARRPKLRIREIPQGVGWKQALTTGWRFLLVPRGGPWPLESIDAERRQENETDAANAHNIQYHYDLSNAFYRLFLDRELLYSCAYFTDWNNDLDTAQRDKLDMICRKLRLKADEKFLDIGCGWGALVCHAATQYGVRAHGVTLSAEQFTYASERVARLGLQDRVAIELKDYTELKGKFDKIASIGMFEHVGIDRHARYFGAIHRLLAPDGLYLHHAITRPAKRNERAFRKRRPEYAAILRYIFPGAELDHIGMSAANLERFGFEVHNVEGWREHYARTCRLWHDRLLANREAAEREVGEVKTRLWLLYLVGCSIGFARGSLGVFQTLASKRRRGAAVLPPTRADLYR